MAPRATALHHIFGYSRKAENAFLYRRFGRDTIGPFLMNQVYLPIQWIKILDVLDEQQRSWDWILEITPRPGVFYRLHFRHFKEIHRQWNIETQIKYDDTEVNDLKVFTDRQTFYKYVLFLLIRIPKRNLCMVTLPTGPRHSPFLKNGSGTPWNRSTVVPIQQALGMSSSRRPPVPLGSTVSEDFMVAFWNSKKKKEELERYSPVQQARRTARTAIAQRTAAALRRLAARVAAMATLMMVE